MPTVSVIMPVYNAVKYLANTIESILNQTYKDFELILIDDGATDGSSEICKDYAQKDSRIIYINQQNKGICAARNKGILIANGKYLAFSDHDDIYELNYLQRLYDLAEESNADVVKCSVKYYNQDSSGKIKEEYSILKEEVILHRDIIDRYCEFPICFWGVWNALYKRELIRKNFIEFDETMKYGQEDFMFNIELLPHITKMASTSECLYVHYKRLSQSTSSKFNYKRMESSFKYAIRELETLQNECEKKQWKKILPNLLGSKITGCLSYLFLTENSLSKYEKIKLLEEFCEKLPLQKCELNILNILINFRVNVKRVMVLLLAKTKSYRLLINIYSIFCRL